jgi:hypothetical protein
VLVALAAACSAGGSGDDARERGRELDGVGVRARLPPGWDGRIADRGWQLPGAATVTLANFRLAGAAHEPRLLAERRLRPGHVLIIVSETLPGEQLPVERARVERGERRRSVDRFFRAAGRAFVLQVRFGRAPPRRRLVSAVNGVLAGLAIERRDKPLQPAPDPPPARALGPVRLVRSPPGVARVCRRVQARSASPVLCPAHLPRAFIGWPRGAPAPKISASPLPGGINVGYGAPWEPDSGPDWRLHLWRNRPCCFLHFEVFRRPPGRAQVPATARPAALGGRRGLLADASSYGLASGGRDYLYYANHTRFLWRERGVPYVATLHRFGTADETRALLGRLLRGLRPVRGSN